MFFCGPLSGERRISNRSRSQSVQLGRCLRAGAVTLVMLALSSAATAQTCPPQTTETVDGPTTAPSTFTIPIDLLPCQTLSLVDTASRTGASTNIVLKAFSAAPSNNDLFESSFLAGNVTVTVPAVPYPVLLVHQGWSRMSHSRTATGH